MMHRIHNFGDFLRSLHKTGPAAEHHMGPILPTGSLLTPGAHPKHKDAEKSQDKKDDKKKDAKKENKEKKDEKKEDSKPKSEGESHSV